MTPQTRDPESLAVTRGPTESKDKTGTITCNLSCRGRVVAVTHQTTTGMSIHLLAPSPSQHTSSALNWGSFQYLCKSLTVAADIS